MADYPTSAFAGYAYNTTDGSNTLLETRTATGTLDDLEGDTTWEVGDVVFNHGTPSAMTYVGTVDVPLSWAVAWGGTYKLPVVATQGLFPDPNIVAYQIFLPQSALLSDFIFSDPFDFSTLSTADFVTCFAEGTRIATPTGESVVEALRIGDTVCVLGGREVEVKWIGRQTIFTRFGPAERLMPVRIAAGSLGDGLPHTDLTVTADHGMLVSGVICHAGALVNGTTITRVPLAEMGESYTVYHIETDAHEIILANGAPAETFIDNVSRRAFDNYAEFAALYGDVPEMDELPYPRAMSARQVPGRIVARLGRRLAG
ncbi:Hint domain-containing protein [Nioella sp. MMSF_3534]|uniref:Hint domain-containing protein n=1 Tax=Nioella sp. MMSF_3534 TaxID=3046720 RepID=UPI00273F452F|nr:Hint domain-containing protein [Nioella sp. MMSF_3534]